MLEQIKTIYLMILFLPSILAAQDKIDFFSRTTENNQIQFSKIYEKGPVLVNFWATWCKPCRAEMKQLQEIFLKYRDSGFTILGINQDTPKSIAKVKSFISTHDITYPILTDPSHEIFEKFNGQSIPLSVLYNQQGEVVYSHLGYLPGDEIKLESAVKKVLGIEQ